jgi:hypothetical protein
MSTVDASYLSPCGRERIFLDLALAKSLENPSEGICSGDLKSPLWRFLAVSKGQDAEIAFSPARGEIIGIHALTTPFTHQ